MIKVGPAVLELLIQTTFLTVLIYNLTLVLRRGGGGYHPLTVCLRLHKNAKESDPGHVGHLFYILCGHFDEKKNRGTP